MIIKTKFIDGVTVVGTTDRYTDTPKKEWISEIIEITLYTDNGKKLLHRRRHFKLLYKKFKYVPTPEPPAEAAPEETKTE